MRGGGRPGDHAARRPDGDLTLSGGAVRPVERCAAVAGMTGAEVGFGHVEVRAIENGNDVPPFVSGCMRWHIRTGDAGITRTCQFLPWGIRGRH